MKRAALAVMLFLGEGQVAFTQGGFIVEFDSVQVDAAGGNSIREKGWGFLVIGHQLADDGSGRTHCMNYRIDDSGQFMDRMEWDSAADHNYFLGMIDPVVDLDEGGHQACVNQYGGGEDVMYLYHLDDNGIFTGRDTILSLDPADSVQIGVRHARGTTDGGMVVTGWRDVGSAYPKAFLLKIDSNSQVQWLKEFAPTQSLSLYGWGVTQYLDGGYLLTGNGLGNGAPDASFLLRTDTAGNQLWRRYYGGRSAPYGAVRVDSAGDIYTWSDYKDPSWPFNDWYQVLLRKWSPSGGLVWETRSHYFQFTHARDFEILPDGSLITCATYGTVDILAKYGAGGDSLWTRYLHVFSPASYPTLYDVQPTSDGGFALTGYVVQDSFDESNPTPGLQTLWVVKTDSLGCVIPGCQEVGVGEYLLDLQKRLAVSPNPASEQVNVVLSLPETGEIEGQARVLLLDASGRTVLEHGLQRNLNQLRATVDVSALPAGLYYLHLRDGRRWLAGSKLVVE